MKKFLAITLTLALTLALFVSPIPTNAVATTQSTTNVLFEDNFDSYVNYNNSTNRKTAMIENGWEEQSGNSAYTSASTGSYVAPYDSQRNMMLSIENTKDWAGYSVSGTISFSDVQEERTSDIYAVYVMYANELTAGGYEIGFCLNVDGTKKLIIRRRKSSDYSALQCSSRLFDFKTDGTVYRIKAEYNSGVINCYIDGVLELSYDTSNDDVMLTKGSAGIRRVNNGAAVTFDNFKVERAEKTVWFSEDFAYDSAADMQAAGWSSADVMYEHIENDKFNLSTDKTFYTIKNGETFAWDDYSVESDFVVTRNDGGTRSYFGIAGRMNGEYGYAFTIQPGSTSSNNITARIRKFASPNATIGEQVQLSNNTFVAGETYNLKLEMIGNTLNGYINGELVCSGTDDSNPYTCGTAGYYIAENTTAFNVVVDNFKVTDYQPVKEYVNEVFDNKTTEQLKSSGWCVNNSEDLSTYINNGKINLPGSGTSAVGVYNTSFNLSNYTTDVDVKVETAPAEATTYQVIAAAAGTNQKGGTRVNLSVSDTGIITRVRLQYATSRTATTLNTALDDYSIPSATRPTLGETVHVSITVRYDKTKNQSYLKARIVCAESGLDYQTAEYELPAGLEYNGYSGVNANAQGAVSFDNFRVYSVNSYVSPTIGDMDNDGIVTPTDIRYIRGYLLGTNDVTSANINGDENSDIRDLVHFKKVAEFYMNNTTRDLVMQRYTQDTVWNGNSFKLLAIGNSFSEDSMTYLYNIAKDQGFEDVKIAIVYRGNTTLKNHYDWASANAAEYTYKYYNAEKQGWDETPNYTILEGIKAEEWDMISLQQNSTYAGLPSYFDTVLDYLEEYIHKNKTNPDCKLAYNVTWAYPAHSTHEGFANYNNDQMYMYNRICEAAYQRIYSSFKFDMVFPTGTAIQNARTSLIGDNLNRDEHHLNTLGRYVAACTLFRTISGQPLTELNYVPDTLTIDDTTKAAILEAVNAAAANPISVTQSSYTQN